MWEYTCSGGRWGAIIQWECSFRKRKPPLHRGLSASPTADWWDPSIKGTQTFLSSIEHHFRGKKNLELYCLLAMSVNHLKWVTALSVARHLTGVSNGFYTRLSGTENAPHTGQHLSSSLNLYNCALSCPWLLKNVKQYKNLNLWQGISGEMLEFVVKKEEEQFCSRQILPLG